MKKRVRMIIVLVCVFVVLPVVGGLVYSFSVSAEAAAWGVATPSTCAVAACRRLAQR